jgi:hypothetical protein
VDEVVAEEAEVEVFRGGGATVDPVDAVVGFAAGGWPLAAGEQAAAVT